MLAIVASLIVALWEADKAREQRDLAQRENIRASASIVSCSRCFLFQIKASRLTGRAAEGCNG